MNLFDKLYVMLLEAFLFMSEREPELLAKGIFSLLIWINILNLTILFHLLFGWQYLFNKNLFLILFLLVFAAIYFQYSKTNIKKKIKEYIEQRDSNVRKRSWVKSILLYLGSFGLGAILVVIKNW